MSVDAQTRTLRNTPGPAELPPADFTGSQYTDSRGCIFIRVGVAGETRWVPRVNRDRSVVCIETITSPEAPSDVAEAETPPASQPVESVAPVLSRVPEPAPAQDITVAAPPIPEVQTPPVTRPPAPQRTQRAAAPRPAPQRVSTPSQTVLAGPAVCGASALSQRYLRDTPRCRAAVQAQQAAGEGAEVVTDAPVISTRPARPGLVAAVTRLFQRPDAIVAPQAPVGVAPEPRQAVAAPAPQPVTVTRTDPHSRVRLLITTPAPVVSQGQPSRSAPAAQVPTGFRPAWDDDRLNPFRGPRGGP